MARLIEDMLDLARARLAGGIPLRPTVGDLGELVHRVVQEYQTAHPGSRIEMESGGDLRGAWDVDRLAQVASNLVGNAIQHGEPGQAVRVCLDGKQSEVGHPHGRQRRRHRRALLPNLFDPFRGGEREGTSEGLGLGLYIVQQIVQAHQGQVQVDALNETHTVFSVTVPRGLVAVKA